MKTSLKSISLVCLSAFLATATWGQTVINGARSITGAWDASNAASSKPAKTGTALPMTCGIGEQFFKTDAAQGQNLYFCTGSNTWVQMTGGSGGSGGSGGGSAPSVLIYKGDIGGFSNQNVRIPVGPDGSNLTADSTQGSGLGYRLATDSNTFANRPACTPALTGETYYPTDGLLAYRCNGTSWTAFGPISPITAFRVTGSNSYGVVGTGSTILTAAATGSGNLTVSSCQSFPSTVTMVVVDSEVIAGTCVGATFTPISGGRGYNQTTPASHSLGAAVSEQLFVWANYVNGSSTQGTTTVAANAGYIAFNATSSGPLLVKPVPNGPGSPYTVTGGFILNGLSGTTQGCGLGFRRASDNKIDFVQYASITYSQTGFIVGSYMIADGSFSGAYFNYLAASAITGNGLYFRLQDTGSVRNTYVSSDGLNFALVHTVANGDFMLADQVFLSCNPGNIPQLGSFFSWTESQ
jgi:hypothetical protein